MKYILIHEETCDLAIVETTPKNMECMINHMGGFNILRAYGNHQYVNKWNIVAENEEGFEYETFVYSIAGDVESVFRDLFPNDTLIKKTVNGVM